MTPQKYNRKNILNHGLSLIVTVIFMSISVLFIIGLTQWAVLHAKLVRQSQDREFALQVAEAGIEYYRWHLAHAPTDFQDGQATPASSYTHEYYDKDGNHIGKYILYITAPPVGSTLVTIVSEGRIDKDPNIFRKIKVQMGIPSWAKYSFAANDVMRFGAGTEVFGEIRSNEGIRFDGIAHNLVSSAKDKYTDPDSGHAPGQEFGVHTHVSPVDPNPPAPVPSRPDVFMAGRSFPVGGLDFTGISADLAQLKIKAQSGGLYFAGSGALGYNIVLKTNGTFDLYQITSLVVPPSGCSAEQSGWGTWSIQNQTLLGNYSFPSNGIVFLEDNVWVEGQINNGRITIASGRFPESTSTNTSITINNNLTYTNFDGKDVIGLIAQQDFNVGLKSLDNLTIAAAIVAKNGRVGRFYYPSQCGAEYIRNSLTLFGAITTNKRYGFAYGTTAGTTAGTTGYLLRTITYDANLLYGPPPSWPLTADQYTTLLWVETY